MDQPPDFQPRGFIFDRTINVPTLLMLGSTLVAIAISLLTFWGNLQVREADHESRLRMLENALLETRATTTKLADTESQNAVTIGRLSLTLEFLAKQSSSKSTP